MRSQAGWLVLSYVLTTALVFFIFAWTLTEIKVSNQITGPLQFGVLTQVDSDPVYKCGTDGKQRCVFLKGNLDSCIQQCNLLEDICQAFTFNLSTSTMKIVDPSTSKFESFSSDMFVRQSPEQG